MLCRHKVIIKARICRIKSDTNYLKQTEKLGQGHNGQKLILLDNPTEHIYDILILVRVILTGI